MRPGLRRLHQHGDAGVHLLPARIDVEPGPELADYAEYAHLYGLAWSEPALRWLFSWLPSLMIFDDHDIRDDRNTSVRWREQMETTSWWHGRIVAGLGSTRGRRGTFRGRRSVLDERELEWLDTQLTGGHEHLLVATSLPFLLPRGLHHLEAWNEAMVDGAWGKAREVTRRR